MPPFIRLPAFCLGSLLALTACDVPTSPSISADPSKAKSAEADIVIEAPIIVEEATTRRSRTPRTPRQQVITAGDIDDTRNLAAFSRYLSRTAKTTKLPRLNLTRPVLARVTGPDGAPAPGVAFTLRKSGAASEFYSGVTGIDGDITVFPATLGVGRPTDVTLRLIQDDQTVAQQHKLKTNGTRQKITMGHSATWQPDFLDLMFVIDTTGSMGDELAWLTKEMRGIVTRARGAAPGVDIRYGLVAYRDDGDDYIVRNFGFTKSAGKMQRQLRQQSAAGGGDYPEAAARALNTALDLQWRRGRGERILIHIADAPPHDKDAKTFLSATRKAVDKKVHIYGLGASGVAEKSEFLMRQAAAATQGRYLFLTDDSGVGRAHAEPSIGCYRVTRLTSLMTRILQSELTGKRIEAPESDVIREVGAYRNGTCVQ